MNQVQSRAKQSIQAVHDGWDRAFAEAKGQKHLIELLRMALRVEQLAHDLTRRTMEHTEIPRRASQRSSAPWSLSSIAMASNAHRCQWR